MAWTEIGLGDSEYSKYAGSIRETHSDWVKVEKILNLDVCGSFAFESGLFVLAFTLPVFLGWFLHQGFLGLFLIFIFFITPMPDWGYDEKYLRNRMRKWESGPRWLHFLNPIRVMGYPLALMLTNDIRKNLKHEFQKQNIT